MNANASTTSLFMLGGVGHERTQESIALFNQLLENGNEKISDPTYELVIKLLQTLTSYQMAWFTQRLTESIVTDHNKALRLVVDASEM